MTKKPGSNQGEKRKSVLVSFAALLIVSTVLYCIAYSWIDVNLGFFYWAGYSLLILPAYYAGTHICRSRNAKAHQKASMAGAIIIAIAILSGTIFSIEFLVQYPHNVFLTEYRRNNTGDSTELNIFMNNTMDGIGVPDVLRGYNITRWLGEDPIAHGIFGIIYGALSMLVAYIGWYSTPKVNDRERGKDGKKQEETETARVIFNFNIVLSIILAVIILAAGNPMLMSSLRYAFIAMSFILTVLLFTLGFLASSKSGVNSPAFPGLFMALVVSFTIGFVVGNMAFPITRATLGTFRDRPLYGVYPGQYVFMCTSMLAIAIIGLVFTDRQSSHQQPLANVRAVRNSTQKKHEMKMTEQPEEMRNLTKGHTKKKEAEGSQAKEKKEVAGERRGKPHEKKKPRGERKRK